MKKKTIPNTILAVLYGVQFAYTTIWLISVGPGSPLERLPARLFVDGVWVGAGVFTFLLFAVKVAHIFAYGSSQEETRRFIFMQLPIVALFLLVRIAFAVNSQFMESLANEFGTAAFHVLSNVVEGGVWKP